MSENEFKRIIEINGVKVEVDLRDAKRVDAFRIGDKVKILIKGYNESYAVHHGVIVAFDEFKELPSITVCYVEAGYSADIKFAYVNAKSQGVEIVPCNDEILIERDEIIHRLNAEIVKYQATIEDIERKKKYFIERFGEWFKPTNEEA